MDNALFSKLRRRTMSAVDEIEADLVKIQCSMADLIEAQKPPHDMMLKLAEIGDSVSLIQMEVLALKAATGWCDYRVSSGKTHLEGC